MEDAIRTWIEKRDESICRALEGMDPETAIALEAMSWLSQINWDAERVDDELSPAEKMRNYLLEYGKSPELIEEMRNQWKEWKT